MSNSSEKSPANLDNLLFDLDGTVTDSREGIINSYLFAIARLNLTENDHSKITEFIGRPLHTYFAERHLVSDGKLSHAVDLYREYYSVKGIYENRLYDGIEELLELLNGSGKRLYLVTGKPSAFAIRILEHFKIEKYFINIYGSDMGTHNSTKTELISRFLKNEKTDPGKSLMIGDRKEDVLGGESCGVHTAGVTYGFGDEDEIVRANPDIIFRDVFEMIVYFRNKKG